MYIFAPKALAAARLPKEELKEDRKKASYFGDCSLGKKAVYFRAFGMDNMAYIPLESVTRVFKRVAITEGTIKNEHVTGSLIFLVVEYEGKEKQVRFKVEKNLNAILRAFERKGIPCGKK